MGKSIMVNFRIEPEKFFTFDELRTENRSDTLRSLLDSFIRLRKKQNKKGLK